MLQASISDLCRNPIKLLEKYKDSGINLLGYLCSYVPEELIISAGLQPYRIPNLQSNPSPLTPTFICQFASAVLENILKLEDFFSGFILVHTCDPMWRLYDILKKKVKKPVFFLRAPHNTESEISTDFFKMELLQLQKFLTKNFEVEVSIQTLSEAIQICNENRSLLKKIYLMNADGRYCIKAQDRFKLVLASMWLPKKDINAQIKAKALDHKSDNVEKNKVRLHINGTAIYDLNLFKIVEDAGCFIASDDLCTGSRYFWDNVEESEDPIYALARRYIQKTPCPSHSPLKKRLNYLDFMIEKFKVQGALTITGRFCDPMLYDAVHIKDMLVKNNVPTMLIDYENLEQETGRIKARVEAFIESLSG